MSLCCLEETRAQFWDSRHNQPQDDWLDGDALNAKLSSISDLWNSKPDPTKSHGRLILVSSGGDPAYAKMPLHISPSTLDNLLAVSQISVYAHEMLSCGDLHISHHVHYSSDEKPSGLTILIRYPRNVPSTVLTMRVRFADRACVCFLFVTDSQSLPGLRETCKRERERLVGNPLLLLALIYKERKHYYDQLQYDLIKRVREAETASGMIPKSWAMNSIPPERLTYLRDLDEPNLINHMHATHTELCYAKIFSQWAMKHGKFCFEMVDLADKCRNDLGLSDFLSIPVRSEFEESVRFTMGRWEQSLSVVEEMLQRLNAQINVVFSIIAQRDSKVSRQIAEDSRAAALLAARDSRTMKTIAIVTLLFLPATLTTASPSTLFPYFKHPLINTSFTPSVF
ncbi:hypothetical protein V8F33_003235 [Rhypophila sp. PSN 637]